LPGLRRRRRPAEPHLAEGLPLLECEHAVAAQYPFADVSTF
jgi:hypothetical protein